MHTLSATELHEHDRIGVSLFVSTLAHMVIVLTVAFVLPKLPPRDAMSSLEITLVQTATERAPQEADYLAQVNQDGGGESERPDIARNPFPVRELGERRLPQFHSAPQEPVESRLEVLDIFSLPSEYRARGRTSQPDKREERATPLQLGLPSPQELQEERARLNAEIGREWQEFQKRPRRRYLNARTREYRAAAYLEAWRAKVQRVGNLNLPDEIRRRNLRGSLQLTVYVRADGSVGETIINRSSGRKVIDDAALRIVRLAAPFDPIPSNILQETDELVITRTWLFDESFVDTH